MLRFLQPGKTERAFDVHADTGIVHLDPRWHQAFYLFAREGFFHILDGTDHLLFLLCLVIPFRKLRPLVIVITSFTVAHSVTLIASAYGMAPDSLWFPPLIETLIAISIVYMAFENIVGAKLQRRWIVTFAFGLIHGFGFSFLLRERLQFAGDHLVTSLLAFNVGVEIGQLVVLLVTIPALVLLFRYVVAERIGTILLSALVAHTAWHWAVDRGTALMAYPLPGVHAAGHRGGHSAVDGDRRRGRPGVADLAVDGLSDRSTRIGRAFGIDLSSRPSRASALGGRGLARPRSIPRLDDRAHLVDFHVAAADVDERAGDRAHHVTQESGAADLEAEQPAVVRRSHHRAATARSADRCGCSSRRCPPTTRAGPSSARRCRGP